MSHQFKPGDMALTLIETKWVPVMSVVILNSRFERGEVLDLDIGNVNATQGGWFVDWPNESGEYEYDYYDNQLMPLRGDFAPEHEKARELVQ